MSSVLAYALPDPEHSTAARVVLVAGYVVAAWFWWRSARRPRKSEDSLWWRLGALLLLFLAVNKLFNVRFLSEAGLRALAKAGNWYDRRQPVQFVVAIVLPSVLAIWAAILAATKGKAFFRRQLLALAGWVLLTIYLALRQSQEWKPAIAWLEEIGYYDWRLALELAGIALVVFNALIVLNGKS